MSKWDTKTDSIELQSLEAKKEKENNNNSMENVQTVQNGRRRKRENSLTIWDEVQVFQSQAWKHGTEDTVGGDRRRNSKEEEEEEEEEEENGAIHLRLERAGGYKGKRPWKHRTEEEAEAQIQWKEWRGRTD